MEGTRAAIFWDYDSCPIPINLRGLTIANNINFLASRYGQVISFKLYMNEAPPDASEGFFSELASCGVSLIAHAGPQGDSSPSVKLLSDLLVFALDFQSEPNTIIILISGNPQHTYPLSMLHRRSFSIVLITTRLHQSSQSLQLQASYIHDWTTEILKISEVPAQSDSPGPSHVDNRALLDTVQASRPFGSEVSSQLRPSSSSDNAPNVRGPPRAQPLPRATIGPPLGVSVSEASYSTKIAQQTDNPSKPNDPAHIFRPLITALQALQAEGDYQPLRSVVGARLRKSVYTQAGATSFSQYVTMAASHDMVELGGQGGKSWISLPAASKHVVKRRF